MSVNGKTLETVVCSPDRRSGGVKTLYAVCEGLTRMGRSTIATHLPHEPVAPLASWFRHECQRYDFSYVPDVLLYPEVLQVQFPKVRYHVCLALGRYDDIKPHSDLTVCKSPAIERWVREQNAAMPTAVIHPGIDRAVFEYDGRPKKDLIAYMTRENKFPETAERLRERYRDRVVEIAGRSEAEVAEILKDARVFVWRGNDQEGSPRPPKEALVAGCVVVGLAGDLHADYYTDFGLRCASVEELLETAGEALKMPVPEPQARAVVRDKKDETRDWLALMERFVA